MTSYVIPVKDGNPYPLGRNVNHDERSRAYAFDVPHITPKSVSWQRRAPIFDQGQLGSCTGNAAAGWIGTDNALRQGESITKMGAPVDEALAVAGYSWATHNDPYSGVYPPDDTGSDGLSVTKWLKSIGEVDSYTHGFSFDAFLAAMQVTPVLLGTHWYDQMFDPDASGLITVGGDIAGGHEYVATAIDMTNEIVTCANSWGTGWGKEGYFRYSFATLERLLGEDGDCTVPHAVVVAPTPPPTPPPTPSKPSWWDDFLKWIEAFFKGSQH